MEGDSRHDISLPYDRDGMILVALYHVVLYLQEIVITSGRPTHLIYMCHGILGKAPLAPKDSGSQRYQYLHFYLILFDSIHMTLTPQLRLYSVQLA
jgi:hypothetical protein